MIFRLTIDLEQIRHEWPSLDDLLAEQLGASTPTAAPMPLDFARPELGQWERLEEPAPSERPDQAGDRLAAMLEQLRADQEGEQLPDDEWADHRIALATNRGRLEEELRAWAGSDRADEAYTTVEADGLRFDVRLRRAALSERISELTLVPASATEAPALAYGTLDELTSAVWLMLR